MAKISVAKASLICMFFMFLTFSATMLVLAIKPMALNNPYHVAKTVIAKLEAAKDKK